MADLAVIIPAAGLSSRFGNQKLLADLDGQKVIVRSIQAFAQRADVGLIVVALRSDDDHALTATKELLQTSTTGPTKLIFCAGGDCRARSVSNALTMVPPDMTWVAVHDAARPLVSQHLIDQTLAAAVLHGAAVPAVAVSQTIKRAESPLPAAVIQTVPRDELWAIQTPQIMRRADLQQAFDRCPIPLERVTDDAQLLEMAYLPVWLTPGEHQNIKITTPQDLQLAHLLLQSAEPVTP